MIKSAPFLGPIASNIYILIWKIRRRPVPPPHVFKVRVLKDYARKFSLRTLVETGTYKGDMIFALKDDFARIYSIELDRDLFTDAVIRFKDYQHIKLIYGDSDEELPKLTHNLNTPALFWLDAHYSGGKTALGSKVTPIKDELHCILQSGQAHVILVDDMRLFGIDPGYPDLGEIVDEVREMTESSEAIEVVDDIMRIVLQY